jgi:hypothetical protein
MADDEPDEGEGQEAAKDMADRAKEDAKGVESTPEGDEE